MKKNQENKKVKLQVICCTYNHVNYIEEALKGFVSQKTNFPFEVLVGDDCSTDGTSEIVARYAQKYPNIIKHIRRVKNMGAQKNSVDLLERIDAEYMALCEGDDYWIDENKLQKQVDFLDQNKHINGCFHNAEIRKEAGVKYYNADFWFRPDETGRQYWPNGIEGFEPKKLFYIKDILSGLIPTASVVYRWDKTIRFPEWFKNGVAGDRPFHCFMIKSGAIAYLNETMSVYRVSPTGAWFNKNKKKNCAQEIKEWVDLIKNINSYFDGAYENIFSYYWKSSIKNGFKNALELHDTKTLYELIKLYPDVFYEFYDCNRNTPPSCGYMQKSKKFVKVFGIPFLKIKINGNTTKYYLFNFIKILTVKGK